MLLLASRALADGTAQPQTQLPLVPPAATRPGPGQALPAADTLPAPVAAALQAAGLPTGALALAVIDPSGQLHYQHRADQPMPTASLMKLVLTLGALEQLGPAFRFHTDLFADPLPAPGHGWQLALRGGGDPGLQQDALRLMLRRADALGVDRLGAPVVLDDSRFAPQSALGSGIRDEPGRVWTTLPAALTVDLAAVTASLPAARQGRVLLDPPWSLQHVPAAAGPTASAAPCAADWLDGLALVPVVDPRAAGRASAQTRGTGDLIVPGQLRLQGDWPANCPAGELRRSPLPALTAFGWTLAALWRDLGHREAVTLHSGNAPSYASVMVRQSSRPLAELVRDINKYSNNLMARTLLLDLAAEQGELPATAAAGERVLQRWLASHQMQFDELQMENGAGLSHHDQLSAAHLATLLKYALTSTVAPEFMASLPIPGQDGTLLKRFATVPGAAAMRLKTGSLDDVRGLAGYVPHSAGGYWVVVCMLHAPGLQDASAVMEALLRSLSAVAPPPEIGQ